MLHSPVQRMRAYIKNSYTPYTNQSTATIAGNNFRLLADTYANTAAISSAPSGKMMKKLISFILPSTRHQPSFWSLAGGVVKKRPTASGCYVFPIYLSSPAASLNLVFCFSERASQCVLRSAPSKEYR